MEKDSLNKSFLIGRVFAGVLMVLFVLLTPWWLYLSLVIFFLFYFNLYYEAVLIGFLVDMLYGPLPSYAFPFFFTLVAIVAVFFLSLFKSGFCR